jgi:hypothetical protein
MVKNVLKLTIQTEKIPFFGIKYSKIAVKNAATLIIAATVPVLELCEKIKEINLKTCLWQAVKKRFFLRV